MDLHEIAQKILKQNPGAALSGSLVLKAQGVPLRREPKDIDIYLPRFVEFNLLPGMKEDENDHDAYDEEYFMRRSYKYEGFQIDTFTPHEESEKDESTELFPDMDFDLGCKIISKFDILRLKMEHAFGEHYSRFKHRQDLIHILVNLD